MDKHRFNFFPEMLPEDYARLKDDIDKNGYDVNYPIWFYEGQILDGWNRQRACNELNIEPVYAEFSGNKTDAIEFVMRSNKRRNLSSSQWAAIAVEAEDIIESIRKEARERMIAGKPNPEKLIAQGNNSEDTRTASVVADLFNTNSTYIKEAQRLKEQKPKLFEAVKNGEKTITEAKREEKHDGQKERFNQLKEKELQPFTDNNDVIIIDPPWKMEKIQREVAPMQIGFDYPTMTIEEIKAIKLPNAPNCHVFMWITHKHLPYGFDIYNTWGVKYVCCFVWHKNGGFQPFGLPQYNCEFILYGRIGTPEFYDLKDFNVCFNADRTGHSEKPESFYTMIKRVTAGKRTDIFGRRAIDGFNSWGNEV
jgi:N6-adenosine-specific RNA methylase IME4